MLHIDKVVKLFANFSKSLNLILKCLCSSYSGNQRHMTHKEKWCRRKIMCHECCVLSTYDLQCDLVMRLRPTECEKNVLKCKKILRLRSFIKTDHKIFVVSLMYFCENSSENSCGSVRYLINLFSSFSWKQNKNKTELTTLPSSLLRILVETPPSHLSSFYPGWRQCCIVFFLLGSSVRK